MMHDEGPSEDDLKRFGGDSGYCQNCGEEIWDDVEVCPKCGQHVAGQVSSREPIEQGCRKQWIIMIVIAVLIGLLLTYVF